MLSACIASRSPIQAGLAEGMARIRGPTDTRMRAPRCVMDFREAPRVSQLPGSDSFVR